MVKMAISQTIRRASPFLKWAGGKTQLLPSLLKNIPAQFGTYVEPFVGGGALFFELQPAKAILADSNPELINCYTVVRDNVEDLMAVLSTYPYSEEFYYKLRAEVPADVVLRAARIIYLNRTCYNGLYRVNKRGHFNVPFGKYKNPVICDAERLRSASYALRNTELLCADYQETLQNFAKPDDFVYIDPPYHPVSKYSDFKRYTTEFFYKDDQRMLAEIAKELAEQGCYVLVSNSYCDFILDLYEECKIIEVPAKRNINKDPKKRGELKEVLVVCKPYHSNSQRISRQLALWEVSGESSLLSGML
jgi:DNA adenine methylase